MAQQTIAIGTSPNDGTGDTLRDAYDKCNDNFTELYNDVAALGAPLTLADFLRSKVDETCDGSNGQVIAFSSAMPSTDFVVKIIDYQGIGIEQDFTGGNPVQTVNGFTINSLVSGEFSYIALIEV